MSQVQDFTLEVCVDSVESAVAAECGGAHRLELCGSLAEGGITPSAGLIAAVRAKIKLALHVMIRPRSADFCYSEDEFHIMQQDIATAKNLGADGVVFGVLNLDGSIDTDRTHRLAALAAPLKVTFHRAFDMSCDLLRSLEDLRPTGAHYVLTSGGQPTAMKGIQTIKGLADAANSDLTIIAGGGVDEHNVASLIAHTGVRQVHASLKTSLESAMRFQNPMLSMGDSKGREYQRFVVDEGKVRNLIRAAVNGR